ncbi:MAG: protein kinase [Bryobacterales bacterium]|nr:protein kinase [Bryobacterales bacterium]
MVDVAELCMGCMEPRGAGDTCAHCGYREGTEPDSPLHLRPRTELHGQYLIGKVLGHGGFGVTYLGWDLNLARKIAIKEYLPSGVAVRTGANSEVIPFSGDSRKDFEYGLERYLDEARTVARFQTHPSVVSVLNFFRANGTAYLVMEYLEGTTFERYLDSHGGKTAVDTVLTIMVPVLEALGSVHQQGILHRDISPDNIYITRKWQIKVLDFGAARYALGQKSRNLSVILKEGYAPVEQYHSKGNQGPWTDVYACGATIYRALTGKIPPASLDRMQGDDLRPLSEMGVEIAPQQERAILKALAVQPDARFHSMQEFRDVLTGVTLMPVDEPAAEAPSPDRSVSGTKEQAAQEPKAASEQRAGAEEREVSSRETPRTHSSQKASLPKWVWAAAAGMLIALAGIAGYKQWDDNRRQIEARKQREIAKVRFEEEMKRQEALRQETERRRLEREKEEALLKQQQEMLDQKQRELAEKEKQVEQQRLRSQQQKAPVRQEQRQTQQQQNGNPYDQLNNNLRLRQQQMQQQLQQQLQQQQALRPQQQQQQQQQFTPPTPTYDDLMRQAHGFSRARNYQASMQATQAAIRTNPNRPEAYANAGWVALYGSGDLSTAIANYREALSRGGTVWFHVYHDHLNMTFQQRCAGDLGIAKDHVEFTSQDQAHNFRIAKSGLREVQGNRIPFRPVSGDFHVKSTDGRNFNLISVTNPKAVRDMILQLAGTR